MDSKSEAMQCGNLDCKVEQTRKCVEGLDLAKCPHFGRPLRVEAPLAGSAAGPDGVVLPSGDLLTVADASRVMRRGASRVIAIVGPKEAGKTTLLASVFELFLRGPIGPFHFANSRTLYAFERACHPSRAVSQNVVPKTERTILTDVHFYHLAICENAGLPVDMLLADRGGEDYRVATDDPTSAGGFQEVARADTVTFLVDGVQILNTKTRSSTAAEIVAIAQALIDGDAFAHRPRVAIVLTKYDRIAQAENAARAMGDFERLAVRFRTRFGARFGEMRAFSVAACPSDGSLPLGHGVAELLGYWHERDLVALVAPVAHVATSERFMSRLKGAAR